MQTTIKRLLALLLALSMTLSLLSANVWATDLSPDSSGDASVANSEDESLAPEEAPAEEPDESEPEGDAKEPEASEPEEDAEEPEASEPEKSAVEPEASEPEESTVEPNETLFPGVIYREGTYSDGSLSFTEKIADQCEVVENSTTSWRADNQTGGWYVVRVGEIVTITDRIVVTGSVKLILMDGAKLNANAGITVASGNTLTIYAQSDGANMGVLNAEGGNENSSYCGAGIGGYRIHGSGGPCGTVIIHGGQVNAKSVKQTNGGAGIGGDFGNSGDQVTIYGGSVNATGGYGGAGIGGGAQGNGGSVTIYGGSVNATGGSSDDSGISGAGIGGGAQGNGGSVKIYGGSVNATGKDGAGIGGGCGDPSANPGGGGTVAIYGGEVYASSESGMAIGGGGDSSSEGEYGAKGTLTLGEGVKMYGSGDNSTWVETTSDTSVRKPYMSTVSRHTHDFTYSASGGTITAACGADDCTLTDSTATLSLSAPESLGYDNTDKPAAVDNQIPDLTAPDVTYTKQGDDSFTGVPKEAGTYTASLTLENVKTGSNTTGNVTAAVTYTITDAPYSITVTAPEHGTVTADKETAKFGETVTLTQEAEAGYGFVSCSVTDAAGNDVPVTNNQFTMPASAVTVTAVFGELQLYSVCYQPALAPAAVSFRLSDSDTTGIAMEANAQLGNTACWVGLLMLPDGCTGLNIAFREDSGNWGAKTLRTVYDNPATALGNLTGGGAVILKGKTEIFTVGFSWGDLSEDADGTWTPDPETKSHYFVTADTTDVTVPNPTKAGFDFLGWQYTSNNGSKVTTINAGSGSTVIPIKANGITETVLFFALWKPSDVTVTYDPAGGSLSGGKTASVAYEDALGALPTPTRSGYAFDGWTVGRNVTEKVSGAETDLLVGAPFDASTQLINDLTLVATWKHVHSYAYVTFNTAKGWGIVSEAQAAKYGPYMHIAVCTGGDKTNIEAHQFDESGKCVCGYQKPTTYVELIETYNGRDKMAFLSKPAKNSTVTLSAPSDFDYQFQKWEYSLNGGEWQDLAPYPGLSFAIPGNMKVNAIYQKKNDATLLLKSERYKDDGLLFTFSYLLPEGYTAQSAMVVMGDNRMMGYKKNVSYCEMGNDYGLDDLVGGLGIVVSAAGATTTELQVDSEENLLRAVGPAYLRMKMLNGEAVSVPGKYNAARYQKAQQLNQRNGYAYIPAVGIGKGPNGETPNDEYLNGHCFYACGCVTCKDEEGNVLVLATDPIAVTYNDCNRNVSVTKPIDQF